MNIAEIEKQVKEVLLHSNQQNFIYDLLLAYGKPKASINRLQTPGSSSYNLSKTPGVVLWKSTVCFVPTTSVDLDSLMETYQDDAVVLKHKPRFIIVTNFDRMLAYDIKSEEDLDITFLELPSQFSFFLPWAGMEKSSGSVDSPADVKAAEKMAKLYDLILADNGEPSEKEKHSLNVFLSRLLFCFFAESTDIFADKLFSRSIESQTAKDGSDLSEYLKDMFAVLDLEDRKDAPTYLKKFPYVNGGLFEERHPIPTFTKRSRDLLIQCGIDLDWSEINPDIFGSMIQAVVDVEQRGNMGMHYTSVANIMKVIEPLFLTDLRDEVEKAKGSAKKLEDLLSKLTKVRIFDPACGSGNFLIIAYKELRKLEMEILNHLSAVRKQHEFSLSGIQLSQFFGIELDDFAHEVAMLSLWLAEHQMNLLFFKTFGRVIPALPLKASGNIVCDNALEIPWSSVCPIDASSQTFIMGNPPYLGSKKQDKKQKQEIAAIFAGAKSYKNLDYIACWFALAANYIAATNARSGFVTTNSIVQGDQVAMLWPKIYEQGVAIVFSVEAFKWGNNAKNAAGVTCVVIGLGPASTTSRWIYSQGHRVKVANISPYLTDANDVIVRKRNTPLAALPEMVVGNMSLDGGHLKLTTAERDALIASHPKAAKFIRPLTGGNEFLYNIENWCIWIEDEQLEEALKIPPLKARIEAVRKERIEGGDVARTLVERSHQFRYRKVAASDMLLVPCTSSEKREYLQVGMLPSGSIPLHSAQVVYNATLPLFAILSSRLHLLWTKATCGTLDSRVRYSNVIAYNNFPLPKLNDSAKERLTRHALTIISEREAHSERCVADLYNPRKMPEGLKRAHDRLDSDFEALYQKAPFKSDLERLSHLFAAYEKLTRTEDA